MTRASCFLSTSKIPTDIHYSYRREQSRYVRTSVNYPYEVSTNDGFSVAYKFKELLHAIYTQSEIHFLTELRILLLIF